MNRVHTLSRPSATSKPDRFPGRSARLVLTGPAQLTSPLSRWAVTRWPWPAQPFLSGPV